MRLVPSPPARALLLLGFDDVFAAADAAPEVMTTRPIGLEGLDDRLVEGCRAMSLNLGAIPDLPPGGGCRRESSRCPGDGFRAAGQTGPDAWNRRSWGATG